MNSMWRGGSANGDSTHPWNYDIFKLVHVLSILGIVISFQCFIIISEPHPQLSGSCYLWRQTVS